MEKLTKSELEAVLRQSSGASTSDIREAQRNLASFATSALLAERARPLLQTSTAPKFEVFESALDAPRISSIAPARQTAAGAPGGGSGGGSIFHIVAATEQGSKQSDLGLGRRGPVDGAGPHVHDGALSRGIGQGYARPCARERRTTS